MKEADKATKEKIKKIIARRKKKPLPKTSKKMLTSLEPVNEDQEGEDKVTPRADSFYCSFCGSPNDRDGSCSGNCVESKRVALKQ
jgi:hypothetical protein